MCVIKTIQSGIYEQKKRSQREHKNVHIVDMRPIRLKRVRVSEGYMYGDGGASIHRQAYMDQRHYMYVCIYVYVCVCVCVCVCVFICIHGSGFMGLHLLP
jgi:hypothetical protein